MNDFVDFVGAGLAFPVRLDRQGWVGLVDGDREITQSIELILATAKGERPMRPEFGCGIHDYVFAPADTTTAGTLAYEVRTALYHWEPRIDVEDVDVTIDDRAGPSRFLIDVHYRVSRTNDPRNLVFPFYTIPEE
jgi:phage baseplate assembly protein W